MLWQLLSMDFNGNFVGVLPWSQFQQDVYCTMFIIPFIICTQDSTTSTFWNWLFLTISIWYVKHMQTLFCCSSPRRDASLRCPSTEYGNLIHQIYNLTVESAPHVNIQGCDGWNTQSKIPRLSVVLWPLRSLTGTINGFCIRSLKKTFCWKTGGTKCGWC